MQAHIAIFAIAITVAGWLLFYVSRRIDSLEGRLERLFEALQHQHTQKVHLEVGEIIALTRQLIFLDKRQSNVQWMNRFVSFGYITGFLFGAGGLLLLLVSPSIGWPLSTYYSPVSIVAYLAGFSLIGNSFLAIGVWQVCRRGMREANIASINSPSQLDEKSTP